MGVWDDLTRFKDGFTPAPYLNSEFSIAVMCSVDATESTAVEWSEVTAAMLGSFWWLWLLYWARLACTGWLYAVL